MLSFNINKTSVDKNYSHCYGCGLCTLVCPVWHQSRDICCTPHGHAKAMQSGGEINVEGLFNCILCGACEPVCPENINLMQMMLKLRQNVTSNNANPGCKSLSDKNHSNQNKNMSHKVLLLADKALLEHTTLLDQTLKVLNTSSSNRVGQAQDNGCDISQALQSGFEISPQRLEEFLNSVKSAKKLIVSDCLLKRALQQWLPSMKIISLGYLLSSLPGVQNKLGATDLYIIECKSYNTDFERMVAHYNQLKYRSGCQLNLDLQRLAMPTGSITYEAKPEFPSDKIKFDAGKQAQWILQGLSIERIIVESVADGIAMAKVTNKPIVQLAELLSNES